MDRGDGQMGNGRSPSETGDYRYSGAVPTLQEIVSPVARSIAFFILHHPLQNGAATPWGSYTLGLLPP